MAGKERKKSDEKKDEKKEAADKEKKESSAHSTEKKEGGHEHGGAAKHSSGISWVIVLLACATGLFVPITVAIILVLRARGVCCAKHPHTAVDKQQPGSNAVGSCC